MNYRRHIFGSFVLLAFIAIFFHMGHVGSKAEGGTSGVFASVFTLSTLADDFGFGDGDDCCTDDATDDGSDFGDGDDCCVGDDDGWVDEDVTEDPTEDPIPEILPYCTLSAAPTTIWYGEYATLSWTSKNADTGSINNGVGALLLGTSPEAAGTVSVHPTETTTYTATFSNVDGVVTCATTIIVKKKVNAPVCTLLPEEQLINKGESAKLTWTSNNATTGVMDENVGALTPVAGGSVTVSPLVTTSYKAVFTGPDGEVACHATVKVKTTPPPPYCKLEISKSVDVTSAAPGTSVWYTINFKNIGTKDCTGGGVLVTDVVDARLEYLEETHSSDVSAGYGGDPIYKASDRTLRWNANTLTPGESGFVKWKAKVGTPTACTETIPNTAKITAYEYDNFTRFETSNTVNVDVSRSCTNPAPVCAMTISKGQMSKGDTAVLSWTSTNVTGVTIDKGIGATTTVNGGITVQPQDNTTYTGTFTGPHGTITCQASITITTGGGGCSGNCGRGQQPPKVVLYQKPQLQPLAAVYLSQVPYTGFDAGPITTAIYWTLLVLWSALVAYFLVYRGYWGKILPVSGQTHATTTRATRTVNTIEEEFDAEEEEAVMASTLAIPHTIAPAFTLPTQHTLTQSARGNTEDILMSATSLEKLVEKTLGADRILVSKHGMEVLAKAAGNGSDAEALLAKVSYAARRNYPREDGWIALSDERISETLTAILPAQSVVASTSVAKPSVSESVTMLATIAAEAVVGHKMATAVSATPTSSSAFIQSLVKGEKEVVFAALRDAASKGGVDALMLQTTLDLDRAYRSRIDGGKGGNAAVEAAVAHFTTAELEELVRALSGSIDETYTSSLTAAKLALAHALALASKKA